MDRKRLFLWRGVFCVAVALLAGCGGGGAPNFPREIAYQNLNGQTTGNLLSAGLNYGVSESGVVTNCPLGKSWCLSSLTPLTSREQFEAYVMPYAGQEIGVQEEKQQVLTLGRQVDFSKSQIWALKLGGEDIANVGLKITETASEIEIQAVLCYGISIISSQFLTNVFAVVPRETPTKPIVYLDRLGPYYDNCPLAPGY